MVRGARQRMWTSVLSVASGLIGRTRWRQRLSLVDCYDGDAERRVNKNTAEKSSLFVQHSSWVHRMISLKMMVGQIVYGSLFDGMNQWKCSNVWSTISSI